MPCKRDSYDTKRIETDANSALLILGVASTQKNLKGKPDMVNQDELKEWIESNCPLFWSLLNIKAQRTVPKGLVEYICTGTLSEIEAGRSNLATIEKCLTDLNNLCDWKTVGDNYRRDLSGVDSVNQLAELFCEIALCSSLGKLSGKLQLHPPTGKGKFSDCIFNLHGFDIYAEAKRYADPWPHIEKPGDVSNEKAPYSRSIAKRPSHEKPHDSARPRSMDLRSKLRDVHRQFPERRLNILFVFHRSLGDTRRYLTQALFGDSNFFKNAGEFVLESDGLFYLEEWRNISAFCLARVNSDSDVIFPFAWKNPRALLEMPKPVLDTLCLNA